MTILVLDADARRLRDGSEGTSNRESTTFPTSDEEKDAVTEGRVLVFLLDRVPSTSETLRTEEERGLSPCSALPDDEVVLETFAFELLDGGASRVGLPPARAFDCAIIGDVFDVGDVDLLDDVLELLRRSRDGGI